MSGSPLDNRWAAGRGGMKTLDTRKCVDCGNDFESRARNRIIRCPPCRAAKSDARNIRAAHGYRRGEHAGSPLRSLSALATIHVKQSVGQCQGECHRRHQQLVNGLCVDCRFYGVKKRVKLISLIR